MPDLDSLEIYKQLDSTNMEKRLLSIPQQCRKGWDNGTALQLPPSYQDIDKIVIAGMGGSAIAGDYLVDLTSLEKAPPIIVQRGYDVPPFTDSRTLVIASSYSGATEETLSAFREAVRRKAKVLAITSGGELASLCKSGEIPVLYVDFKGEPRITVGFTFFALLGVFQGLGIIAPKDREVGKAISSLKQQVSLLKSDSPLPHNEAKQIAHFLYQRVPVIYGAEVLSGVARSWKTAMNENGKVWAFTEQLPELNHNSVVGYHSPEEAAKRFAVVFLRSNLLHPRVQLRYRITQDLLTQENIAWREVKPSGKGALNHIISHYLLGTYASYYLAMLNGVDPSPVKPIDTLKSRLSANK